MVNELMHAGGAICIVKIANKREKEKIREVRKLMNTLIICSEEELRR